MPNLFVLIPGFGEPHWDRKKAILIHNLEIVKKGPWDAVEVHVCVYSPDRILEVKDTVVHYEKGIVGHFLQKHCRPDALAARGLSHILLLLDDVELSPNMDWGRAMTLHSDLRLDIISPSLTPGSKIQYPYMVTKAESNVDVFIVNACEMFCYFMDLSGLVKYYPLLDTDNPWLWGIDLILVRHGKLRVGLLNRMTMTHHFKGEGYSLNPHIDAEKDFHAYLAKFNEDPQSLSQLTPYSYLVVSLK